MIANIYQLLFLYLEGRLRSDRGGLHVKQPPLTRRPGLVYFQ